MGKTRGGVAAGHPQTAAAAMTVFEAGGNAFDAIAAAMLASFVTEPTLTSAAGGGFLLAHCGDRPPILYDFFTQTPREKRPVADLDFYPVDVNFGDAVQSFHVGLGAMATPGNLAGVWTVQQELGRLPFGVVAEPAIAYARDGVPLSDFQEFCINTVLAPILLERAESRRIYAPTGRLVRYGEQLVHREFAHTLAAIVSEGIDLFYRGAIADQLVADCQTHGGYLTHADLAHYQVIKRQPLRINYRGQTLLTNPPPSSGGALMAFTLQLLATAGLDTLPWGSETHLRALIRAMQLTNQARTDGYDDRIHDPTIAAEFLGADHFAPYQAALAAGLNRWGSTTHISVMDEWGNAASATTSNGEGSGYMIPGTGIMVNNMLGEADLNPQGFHAWASDRRMSSMMAPTMILTDGQPTQVFGSGGSNRIRTVLTQIVTNLVDFGDDLRTAIARPRLHWESGTLNLEPGLGEGLELSDRYTDHQLHWQAQNMFFGGVHGVERLPSGEFAGAGDDRRGGAFLP
ncbi:gamma-glutamyltransferase [Spirulina major]|uniref:gamma-glutamyltransferase n=1 Tax=Spirulina major TaxID=270636 RepID=UPI00093496F3|nr:gamma-glutamyltransferase [Spirulina major]